MLIDELGKRTLLVDGGMGAELIRRIGVPMKTLFSAPSLNLTHPGMVKQIHKEYLEAGSDIITTNTFTANELMLSVYEKEAELVQQNARGVYIAKEAVEEHFNNTGKRCYVGANIGPLPFPEKHLHNKTLDELASLYKTQFTALLDAEPDLLIIECAYHVETVKALGMLVERVFQTAYERIPIMLTATISKNPSYIDGVTVAEFFAAAAQMKPDVVGFSCGDGLDHIEPALMVLTDTPKVLMPNAGLPDERGEYSTDLRLLAHRVMDLSKQYDIRVLGGCCGTTPAYIAELSSKINRRS